MNNQDGNIPELIKLSISKKFKPMFSVLAESSVVVFLMSKSGIYFETFGSHYDIPARNLVELNGHELEQVFSSSGAVFIQSIIGQVIESQIPHQFQYELKLIQGTRRYEGRISPVKLDREKGHIIWFSREITNINQVKETEGNIKLYDSLTGVDNQMSFYQRLDEENEQCKNKKYYSALVFIDIDDFKLINQKYGHQVGDDVLVTIAERLQTHAREGDFVCRLGRDLFVLLLFAIGDKDTHTIDRAAQIVMNLKQLLIAPIRLKNHFININASIGITTLPKVNKSVKEIIIEAEAALLDSKGKGKGQITTY